MADEITKRLTPKEQRFVNAYLAEARGNATEAARIAEYKDARHAGYELRQKPHIRARIDAILIAESLSAAEVLRELTRLATAPTEHFMQVVRPPITDERGNEYDAIVKQDYSAKTKALELIGRHHKMFTDKSEVAGPDGKPLSTGASVMFVLPAKDPPPDPGEPPGTE